MQPGCGRPGQAEAEVLAGTRAVEYAERVDELTAAERVGQNL